MPRNDEFLFSVLIFLSPKEGCRTMFSEYSLNLIHFVFFESAIIAILRLIKILVPTQNLEN